jgi:hypothetical protein
MHRLCRRSKIEFTLQRIAFETESSIDLETFKQTLIKDKLSRARVLHEAESMERQATAMYVNALNAKQHQRRAGPQAQPTGTDVSKIDHFIQQGELTRQGSQRLRGLLFSTLFPHLKHLIEEKKLGRDTGKLKEDTQRPGRSSKSPRRGSASAASSPHNVSRSTTPEASPPAAQDVRQQAIRTSRKGNR